MTKQTGQTPSVVRDSNIRLVMQLLFGKSGSRSDLAESAGLSNPALTKIVDELLGIGLVKEGGEIVTNARGRKKVDLIVIKDFTHVVGVDFSSNDIIIRLTDFAKNTVLSSEISDCEIITKSVLDKVAEQVKEMISSVGGGAKCICIGVPGKIDAFTGEVRKAAYKYRGLHDIKIKEYFENSLDIRTVVANDASLHMLAEKKYGGRENDSALIYNDFGTGGALWLGGEAFESASGFAAEFGIAPVSYRGKNYIYEDICSINAMLRECGYEVNAPKSYESFLRAYSEGAEKERAAAERSAEGIALLIRSIVCFTGCTEIIINGKICVLGEDYLKSVKKYLLEEKNERIARVAVHYGRFGKNGTIVGAIEKAVEQTIDWEIEKRNGT